MCSENQEILYRCFGPTRPTSNKHNNDYLSRHYVPLTQKGSSISLKMIAVPKEQAYRNLTYDEFVDLVVLNLPEYKNAYKEQIKDWQIEKCFTDMEGL